MPEILIRITTPNKEHRTPCWCAECRGMPGTTTLEWRARPALPPPAVAIEGGAASMVEFCGSLMIPLQVTPAAMRAAIDGAYQSALASLTRRRWQIGDRVQLNPAKLDLRTRGRTASEVGTVTKLLPDGRPRVLWPTWPKHLADEPPPYLDDDLILYVQAVYVEADEPAPPAG